MCEELFASWVGWMQWMSPAKENMVDFVEQTNYYNLVKKATLSFVKSSRTWTGLMLGKCIESYAFPWSCSKNVSWPCLKGFYPRCVSARWRVKRRLFYDVEWGCHRYFYTKYSLFPPDIYSIVYSRGSICLGWNSLDSVKCFFFCSMPATVWPDKISTRVFPCLRCSRIGWMFSVWMTENHHCTASPKLWESCV